MKNRGSFRDSEGFVFYHNNKLYRQVNRKGADNYEFFMNNLYDDLVKKGWVVRHEEVKIDLPEDPLRYKVLEIKDVVPFISYPYEWSLEAYKDAALLTLNILEYAINRGMILKDASAYNIQFVGTKPIFIDTLSFEIYNEGDIWKGYKQFCEHFLLPISLMDKVDKRMNVLMRDWIDGIPLEIGAKLLPLSTYLNLSLLIHIHWHSKYKSVDYKDEEFSKTKEKKISKNSLIGIIDSLRGYIKKVNKRKKSVWTGYYEDRVSYTDKGIKSKEEIVESLIKKINPRIVWDIGSNEGKFSDITSKYADYVVSFDYDAEVINNSFIRRKEGENNNILPLILDLTNPSPSIGWNNKERFSLKERTNADLVMALALMHHLRITANISFNVMSEFFNDITDEYLIIEYIPYGDKMVKKLLKTSPINEELYNHDLFIGAFTQYFEIEDKADIEDSDRVVYLMKKNN